MKTNYITQKAPMSKPTKRYPHRMGGFHHTSMPFMQTSILSKKLIKGDTQIDVNYDAFIRLEALPQPTMGLASAKFNWFYVPLRMIFANYNNFISETLVHSSNPASFIDTVPTVDMRSVMNELFVNAATHKWFTIQGRIDQDAPNPYTGTDYDLVHEDQNGYIYALKLTYKGFCCWNIAHQLGYVFPSFFEKSALYKSALPILAYSKVILDYYIPKQWADFEYNYNDIYKYFETTGTFTITDASFIKMCSLCFYVAYDNDINIMAWNNPSGPNTPTYQSLIDNVEDTIDGVINNASGVAVYQTTAGEISQLALNRLAAMDKLMKKNAIVGTKYWDRLMARFGIKTDKALIKTPYHIESQDCPIILNEVLSTAETVNGGTGANLGALAGRGEASINGECNFKFYAEEDGYLLCISHILPEIGYRNFEDEDVDMLEPLDFWNEEYDATGTQPIFTRNVLPMELGSSKNDYERYWGFLPMYYANKCIRSRVSGKYSIPSQTNELQGWTFCRVFDKPGYINLGLTKYNTLDFAIGTDLYNMSPYQYFTRFDDIFYTHDQHNFDVFFTNSIVLHNNMKPLWDYCLLDEEDEKEYKVDVDSHL